MSRRHEVALREKRFEGMFRIEISVRLSSRGCIGGALEGGFGGKFAVVDSRVIGRLEIVRLVSRNERDERR